MFNKTKKKSNNKRFKHLKSLKSLKYTNTLCDLVGGGFFSFFRKALPYKIIRMNDTNAYSCNRLTGNWESFTTNGQPDYAFFNNNDNIAILKKIGIKIEYDRKKISECTKKITDKYQKSGDNNRRYIEERERRNNKNYKYVDSSSQSSSSSSSSSLFSSSNRNRGLQGLPRNLSSCNNEYKQMEIHSINYLLELMRTIKTIVTKCKNLKHSTKDILSLKCTIILFNNSNLLNTIFSSSSSSTNKSKLDDIILNTPNNPLTTVYTILRGSGDQSSSSRLFNSSSSKSTSGLADLDMDMYFKDPIKKQHYTNFLDLLLAQFLEPTILQLETDLGRAATL
jgi:hypothetical protein